MRKEITFYDDQYKFAKELKSPKLWLAFGEFMFEDKEPTNLKGVEKIAFDSLRFRMENQKKKALAGSKGGSNSHGGGRPSNDSSELGGENKQKTSKKQTEKQAKNKEDIKSISSKLDIQEEDKERVKRESSPLPPSEKNQTSLSIPSVDELYNAYLQSSLYHKVNRHKYSDNGAIKLRLERKQSGERKKDGKKVDAYTTVNGWLRTLKIMLKTVCPGHEMLDAGRRLEFAINNSLLKYDGIFREQKQEDQYLATIETENKDFYI